MKILILTLLIFQIASAKPKTETLFEFTKTEPPKPQEETPKPQTSGTRPRIKAPRTEAAPVVRQGNLPYDYNNRSVQRLAKTSVFVVSPGDIKTKLRALAMGEIIMAEIPHWIIGFPDEKAPVVAIVKDQKLKGATFLGESWLEKNSRRIFIEFKYVTINRKTYSLRATARTALGVPGFEGVYHSNEGALFAGNFMSAFVAGYFEGQIPQTTTPYGTVIQDTTIDSAWKKGMATGAMQTADAFREKLKKVPEFSELRGPTQVEILITDEGKEK
jgi:hypothetical protein